MKFGSDINIGIVTGSINKLADIDVDDENKLKELEKLVPELWLTTRVKTVRAGHYQFYFSTNGDDIRSTSRLFGLEGIELKSKGRYVVSAGSIVDGVRYEYERPLRELKPLPEIFRQEYQVVGREIKGDNRLPVYRGQASCIGQIAREDIPEDTMRHNALLILFNKLIEAGNSKEYSKYFIVKKNSQFTVPLPKKDINFDKADIYHYGCPRINEELDFVDCSNCRVRGGSHVESLLMKNIHRLGELTTAQGRVLGVLDSYFRGEQPTAYEVSKYITNMNHKTILEAMKELKRKEII
ncbi:hypothetical protein ES708_20023 [subsurface metagenome]